MIDTPEIIETEPILIAKVYRTIPISEISREMGLTLKALTEEVASQGIAITGPWFTHHFRRPVEEFDFELCVPVARPVKAAGVVEPGEWPAMTMVRTIYHGGYQGLPRAWGQFTAWVEEGGHAIGPEIWERYLIGPDSGRKSSDWRTELSRPLIERGIL